MVFAQVACKSSEAELDYKNQIGLAISCIGVLMMLAYQIQLDHIFTEH